MVNVNWNSDPIDDELDRRIRSDKPAEPPVDLLDRCLDSVGGPDLIGDRSKWRNMTILRNRRGLFVSAASLLAIVAVTLWVFLPYTNGSGSVLADVVRAFEKAPAYHVKRIMLSPDGKAEECHAKETWVVRDVGRRTEVREGSKLVAVAVDNKRWRFQWDIARNYVVVWPSDPADHSVWRDGIIPREKFLRWAESHKADIVPEKVELNGRVVEKITLRWPGEIKISDQTVWFDPRTYRPLKKRYESDEGNIIETTIEYPEVGEIPKESFDFEVPRGALLEVNDPQLGRQIYSEGQTLPNPGE